MESPDHKKCGVAPVAIDRTEFVRDEELGGLRGRVLVQNRFFDVFVRPWECDLEAAWTMASRAVDLFVNRFHEIENVISLKLSSELDHWTDEPLTKEQITSSVVAAIRGTKIIGLDVGERSASLYADGPRSYSDTRLK